MGEELIVNSESQITIQNSSGEIQRHLYLFPELDTSYVDLIDSIHIQIQTDEYTSLIDDSVLVIKALSTDWDVQNATWTAPWQKKGGDTHHYYSEAHEDSSTGLFEANITNLYSAIYHGLIDDWGFLVRYRIETGAGALVLNESNEAQLKIFYSEAE